MFPMEMYLPQTGPEFCPWFYFISYALIRIHWCGEKRIHNYFEKAFLPFFVAEAYFFCPPPF